MKKLLLLPLVALSLVGCNDNSKVETGWVVVNRDEILLVYCGNTQVTTYSYSYCSLLQYNSTADNGYTKLSIKYTLTMNEETKIDNYYGYNISYSITH